MSISRVFLWVTLIALLSGGTAWADTGQCSDADGDGFSPEAECGPRRDCNDDRADVYPGAYEILDGRDNDCDGRVDDGVGRSLGLPVCAAVEIQLAIRETTDLAESTTASVAWTGEEFGLVWRDNRSDGDVTDG